MRKRLLPILVLALIVAAAAASQALAGNPNGSSGQMPAYYDGQLFTINFKQQPTPAELALLREAHQINTIYMCDACMGQTVGGDANGDFISVLDAIQGDGFNPLWQEAQIAFNPGFTPTQLTSDNDVLAAASGPHPAITITFTDEVYRCSVVGPGPK
jgi:hypothetical protein